MVPITHNTNPLNFLAAVGAARPRCGVVDMLHTQVQGLSRRLGAFTSSRTISSMGGLRLQEPLLYISTPGSTVPAGAASTQALPKKIV